jgi:hypothetical protein
MFADLQFVEELADVTICRFALLPVVLIYHFTSALSAGLIGG